MAQYFSNPHPHSKTLDQRFTRQIILLTVVILAAALAFFLTEDSGIIGIFLALIIVVASVILARRIYLSFLKNGLGSGAEREIAEMLKGLPGNYFVFQNVPIKERLDADFIIVGPNGVNTVEVKSHKKFHQFGSKDFIGQAKAEAMALKQHLAHQGLGMYVGAILVFTRAYIPRGASGRGVMVIQKDWLLPAIQQQRAIPYNESAVANAVMKLYNN